MTAANDNDPDYPFPRTATPFVGFQREALLEWLEDAVVLSRDTGA